MAVAAFATVGQVAMIKNGVFSSHGLRGKYGSTDTVLNVRATVPVIAQPTRREAPCCSFVMLWTRVALSLQK
jgi:hypothetical protein